MSDLRDWFRQHGSGFSGQLLFDEPLARHTYYRIGGPADALALPKTLEDLRLLSRAIRESGTRFFVMGNGSNLLASDEGFRGIVIRAGRLAPEIELGTENLLLRTGSGVAVSSLLRRAAQEGWGGLEFLTGVPGTIGGVIAMNAGTHLGEAKDRVRAVELFDLDADLQTRVEGEALRFEYRKNHFLQPGSVVIAAYWAIDREEPRLVKERIDSTLFRRKQTQPLDFPSCGSVFKNPPGHKAWEIVDKLGLRGHRIGDAQFAEKHSNFIVNLGKASAAEVRGLIELAKKGALDKLGIRLEEEVQYLG